MEGCSRFAIEAVPRQVACRLAPLQTIGVQQSTKELGGDGFCQPLLGAAPGLGKADPGIGPCSGEVGAVSGHSSRQLRPETSLTACF